MLIDLPMMAVPVDPLMAILDGGRPHERLGKGMYLTGLNFNYTLRDNGIEAKDYPFSPWMDRRAFPDTEDRLKAIMAHYEGDEPEDYGVCDYPEQVVEKWPQLETDPRTFVLSFTEMRKEDQHPTGGWRWHKWGTYIGTKEPQCEYLYDEGPEIESVYCFHIFEVNLDA